MGSVRQGQLPHLQICAMGRVITLGAVATTEELPSDLPSRKELLLTFQECSQQMASHQHLRTCLRFELRPCCFSAASSQRLSRVRIPGLGCFCPVWGSSKGQSLFQSFPMGLPRLVRSASWSELFPSNPILLLPPFIFKKKYFLYLHF